MHSQVWESPAERGILKLSFLLMLFSPNPVPSPLLQKANACSLKRLLLNTLKAHNPMVNSQTPSSFSCHTTGISHLSSTDPGWEKSPSVKRKFWRKIVRGALGSQRHWKVVKENGRETDRERQKAVGCWVWRRWGHQRMEAEPVGLYLFDSWARSLWGSSTVGAV